MALDSTASLVQTRKKAEISVVAAVVAEAIEVTVVAVEAKDVVLALKAVLVAVKEDPERRVIDLELRAALVAESVDQDLLELRAARVLPLRVVTRVLSTVRGKRDPSMERGRVSTASRARRENNTIPSTEETVPEEVEVLPKVATVKETGVPLRMRLRLQLKKYLKRPLKRPLLRSLRSLRLRKSLRKRRKLQLRRESPLRMTSMLRSSLLLSTSPKRRSQLSRRRAEPTRKLPLRRLASKL